MEGSVVQEVLVSGIDETTISILKLNMCWGSSGALGGLVATFAYHVATFYNQV